MANEFYTLTTLGTLAGATGATVTVANTLKSVLNWSPRWLGLVTAQAVCLGVLLANGAEHRSDWFVAILNGCLVHLAATGTSAAGAALTGGAAGGATARGTGGADVGIAPPPPRRRFWTRWY